MEQLEDIIVATAGNIYVKPDPVSDIIGVGLGGMDLRAPERHIQRINAGRCRTGVVVLAGWDTLRIWPDLVGKRIAWPPYVGSEFSPAGAEVRVHLGDVTEIMCYFKDGSPDGMMVDDEWCDFAVAAPGTILVERVNPPSYRGSIIVPDGIRTTVRQSEAIIISAGDGVDKATFFPGRRVFLPAESNKRIDFRDRTFYKIYSQYIVGIFKEGARTISAEITIPDPALMMHGIETAEPGKVDDGDPRGPM